jgi:uncharacterized membrane protein (DUF485 family)
VSEESKRKQELKKKNAKVAITLALIAFAIYAGFMLIQM